MAQDGNLFTIRLQDRASVLSRTCDAVPVGLSDKHLALAQKVVDRLLAKGKLDVGDEMYLDALSDLVSAYEDEHHPIGPASDAEMLRHLMDAKGINQARLCRDTGLAKSSVSEVLRGKKPFSRHIIRKLADYFQVDVSVLTANI